MRIAVWLSLFLLPLATAQQSLPLAHGVPDDMHFFVHGMTSATPDPGYARFEQAVRMLADSGIHDDLIDLATLEMSPQRGAEVRRMIAQIGDLVGAVDWSLLAGREMVFTYRMALPVPEYLALFRVSEDRIGEQLAGVRKMLEGFAELAGLPPESVREVGRKTGTLTVFEIQGVPLQLAAAAVGDVLVMSTSTRLLSASMRLLSRGDGVRSLGASERFVRGLEQLPAATEDIVYADVHGLVEFFRQAVRMGMAGSGGKGEEAQWRREVLGLITALVDELDVVDHVLATTQSDGVTTRATTLVQLAPDFEATLVGAVVGRQQSWADWYRRVPADATGFGFDTGMDPAALFDLVVARMRESPRMDALLDQRRPDLVALRDGLRRVSGELAWVSLPATDGGCALGESVCFLRLEDPEAVADMLPGWIDGVAGFLESRGQRMAVRSRDGVHDIALAAFPWIRPTVAVRGDELVLATSPAALDRIDRVRSGRAPDIRQRAEFSALGLGNRDAVEALAFGSMPAGMGGLPDLVAAAGFGLSVLPRERDARPLLTLGAILTKLAPALRHLGMGYDWAMDATPGDGPDTWVTQTVYRSHAQQ